MKNIAIKLLIAAVPILILINKKLEGTSGNSGVDLDLPMMIALLMLLIWAIFMIYETAKFFYLKKNKMALINLLTIIPVLATFIYVGGV